MIRTCIVRGEVNVEISPKKLLVDDVTYDMASQDQLLGVYSKVLGNYENKNEQINGWHNVNEAVYDALFSRKKISQPCPPGNHTHLIASACVFTKDTIMDIGVLVVNRWFVATTYTRTYGVHAAVRQRLPCKQEQGNPHDPYAIAVIEGSLHDRWPCAT